MSDPADRAKRAIKVMTDTSSLRCNKCGRSVPAVAYVIGVGKLCNRCYKEPVKPKRGPLRDFLERIAAGLARRWAKRYPNGP